jgi:hypothetical protein
MTQRSRLLSLPSCTLSSRTIKSRPRAFSLLPSRLPSLLPSLLPLLIASLLPGIPAPPTGPYLTTARPTCRHHTTSISRPAPCQSVCLGNSNISHSLLGTAATHRRTVNFQHHHQSDQKACQRQAQDFTLLHPAIMQAASMTAQQERRASIYWTT